MTDAASNSLPDAGLLDDFDRINAWAQLWTTMRTPIETSNRLGPDEPAAVLHGALAASPTATELRGAGAARMEEIVAGLRTRLGTERLDAWHAEGATLGDHGAVAHARRATGRSSSCDAPAHLAHFEPMRAPLASLVLIL